MIVVRRTTTLARGLVVAGACAVVFGVAAAAQGPPRGGGGMGPNVQRLSDTTYTVGRLHVDTAKREVTASATVNDVKILEFVANTADGFKAYESALTIETRAIAFNTALLLIGLDPSHARVPTRHFDSVPPQGDPVEVWVEWGNGADRKRVRVEELLFDKRTNQTVPEGPWVYTGSSFVGSQYLAETDGVLIGFVHSPAPIIENPRAGGVDAYGSILLNRQLVRPGTKVTLTIKALERTGTP
jgi:hypothetical protein